MNNRKTLQNGYAKFILSVIILSMFSCTSSTKQPTDKEENGINSSKHSSCLKSFLNNYNQLITKEDILKVLDVDTSIIKIEYDTTNTSPKYEVCKYLWPSDRIAKKEIMGRKYTFEVDNKIGIGHFRFFIEKIKNPVQYFKSMYNITEKEKKKLSSQLDNGVGKNQELSNSQKETAKKLGKSITSKMKFSPIEGIGDDAVWDYLESGLVILDQNLRFTVFVDISKEHQKDVIIAKKLAKDILAKCN